MVSGHRRASFQKKEKPNVHPNLHRDLFRLSRSCFCRRQAQPPTAAREAIQDLSGGGVKLLKRLCVLFRDLFETDLSRPQVWARHLNLKR